ncbi:glutathione S-transferase [Gilbertella persicaria]|uniref:glutathione S-transferase n=1 Tax=Gilbertella persicaria TaxID=101096 RepID=UPI00221EF402|nr:glutathione S-transferase [Gilbertella persicaria]KAI8062831.1 glutathione S-transferase [Gilbertella persicaria]
MSGLNNIKLYYFGELNGKTTFGRGEYIRLFLKDAGVDFEYVRCSFEEWGAQKQKLSAQGVLKPTMPYITIDGKYYGKTAPIMRFISKKLGKYQGKDEDEAQLVDAYADSLLDDIFRWVAASFGGIEQLTKKYNNTDRPQSLQSYEQVLGGNQGPYLLGEEVSYADFLLYHYLEDDGFVFEASDLKSTHPHLATFIEAIQSRPNLKKYLATDRK